MTARPHRPRRPTRRRAAAGLSAALAATALVTACTASTNAVDQTAGSQFRFTNATVKGEVIPVADRRAPGDVTGPLLGGKGTYRLSDDVGKVVVVNLFASWCPPCKLETPEFQTIYTQVRDQGVDFVGFAVKDDGQSATSTFVADNGVTYPVVYDQPAEVALQLGDLPIQVGLPLTALIDKQGRVAAAYVGLLQPSQLKPALATLTAET